MTYFASRRNSNVIGRIIRTVHTKNFFTAQNEFARDRRISSQARGMMTNLLTRPDNWVINIDFMCEEMCMGIVAVKNALQELETYGYVIRERIRDSAGRFIGARHFIVESPELQDKDEILRAFKPKVRKAKIWNPLVRQTDPIRNTESNNYQNEEILNLSPTPQKFQYQEEEIDFWLDSPSESIQPEVAQTKSLDLEVSNVDQQEPELTANLSTAIIPDEERSSAVDYIQTTVSNIKPTRKERQSAQRNATWVEFGKENGLWKSLEELQGFMTALYCHAVNNPRLHTPSKWVESEVQKTCDRGTGTHWVEYITGLEVGTIDQKPWTDVSGNVDLSFRSYVEQSKFGESGNSTSRAVELAAQVLSDPFKAGLLWNEYQRRLERELEEKAKCELLGVAYRVAGVLMPKSLVSAAATAQTQQVLGIDAAAPLSQLSIASGATCGHVWSEATSDPCVAGREAIAQSVAVPALEAEVESSLGEAPWDLIAAKMAMLGEKMGITKSGSAAIPLSEVYGEPKPVNLLEAKEFSVWYDLAKAQGLVDYSYGDSNCHAIVVLADGVTALPWREARDLLLE
jgi:hypothetical protein